MLLWFIHLSLGYSEVDWRLWYGLGGRYMHPWYAAQAHTGPAGGRWLNGRSLLGLLSFWVRLQIAPFFFFFSYLHYYPGASYHSWLFLSGITSHQSLPCFDPPCVLFGHPLQCWLPTELSIKSLGNLFEVMIPGTTSNLLSQSVRVEPRDL